MDINNLNQTRKELNKMMCDSDSFFEDFGKLDNDVYADGEIPKKYKELTGLSISIVSKCEECILYHIQECIKSEVTKEEIIEAIKMGVIGGGSVTFPSARFAFKVLSEV